MKDKKKALLKRYCSQIGRKLTCNRQTKRDLLAGYCAELEDQLPKEISEEKLYEKYGSPAFVAAELQDSISEEEVRKTKQRRMYCLLAAAVLIVLICSALFAWYVHTRDTMDVVYYKEVICEDSEGIEDTNEIVWGP